MIHLDLFSGIGGFAYAADQVFGDVEHIFCDNDKFCQQVLRKHWPESEIYGDIRQYTNKTDVDLLTGGFPCQPFSAAGLRRGTADERHLWPEMLRVIRLTEPTWVIAENVRGLLTWNGGMVFEQVCADLESAGYEVQPFVIPAVAVNAPHRRDRIWFVAYKYGSRLEEARPEQQAARRGQYDSVVANATSDRRQWRGSAAEAQERYTTQPEPRGKLSGRFEGQNSHVADTADGRRRQRIPQREAQDDAGQESKRYGWEQDWITVAAELCSVDDGLPPRLVRLPDGSTFTQAGHRKESLKAYGNAIVPQVAMQIMEAIKAATPITPNRNKENNEPA